MLMKKFLLGIENYLVLINVVSFLLYARDKYLARRHKWRISEKSLLSIAAVGGSIGALLAMLLLRHKNRKLKFCLLIPLFIVLQLVILSYLYIKF